VIVLDATILIYAVGSEHPLREPARSLVEAIAEGQLEATTTLEVIQEFVHVRARRHDRRDAATRGRELLRLLSPLLAPDEADEAMALALFERHERLGMFDAVLAATALMAGADGLVSADRAFADVSGLTYVDPASPQLEQLLGA
jgi:predicted nucleic acid-binding protein